MIRPIGARSVAGRSLASRSLAQGSPPARAFVACALAACVLSACAGATRSTPPPSTSAAPPAPPGGARPATPLPPEVDPRDLGERERALLCGPGPGTPGAATFESVLGLVREDALALERKATLASQANDAECRDAVEALDNAFQQLSASSRSLCDYEAARGIGAGADDLMASTEVLRGEIDRHVAEVARGEAAGCRAHVAPLISSMQLWQEQRNDVCAVTPAQRAVSACGVESVDTSQRQRAKRYCDSLAANASPDPTVERSIEQCIGEGLRAPPRSSRAAAASDRSALDADARLPLATPALQTALLRGAADFFAERAERELSLFAYDIVKNRLCDSEELEPFLPNTCELFESEETLAPTPAAIRAAVRADFDALPGALVDQLHPKSAALACSTALAWRFGEVAIEGVDLLDLLGAPAPVLDDPLVRDRGCPQGVRDRIATIARELSKLLADRPRLERAVKAGRFETAVTGDANTRTLGGALNDYGEVLKDVMLRVRRLDQALSAWEKNPSAENRAAAVVAGLQTIDPIVRFAIDREASFDATTKQLAAAHMRRSIELTAHISSHEYSAAVIAGSQLGTASGIATGKTRNLLGLAASLAQAESSDDVRNTLDEAALPLGSWRRKNESRWGATVTGLVGAQLAREIVVEDAPRLPGATGSRVESGTSLAPSLIIGADLHHGLGKGWRAGLQVGLLDLGALLTFRMDDPEVEGAANAEQSVDDGPELRVEQVFSPGLYPYVGLGPFDLGLGASFVPALRSLDTPADTRALDVFRLGIFLAVDVSVLPLL